MKIELQGIELVSDFGKEESDFTDIILQVIGKMSLGYSVRKAFDMVLNTGDKCSCCKSEVVKPVEQAKAVVEAPKPVIDKEPIVRSSKDQGVYKFVIGECSCGQQHYLPIYENAQNPFGVKCRKCGKETKVDYNTLVKRFETCNVCGHVSEFWVSPDDKNLKRVDCRLCRAKISISR